MIVNNIQTNTHIRFGNREDYERLSGKNCIKKYVSKQNDLSLEKSAKDSVVQDIIYNSLEGLARCGKYEAFKFLYNQIDDRQKMQQNPRLFNIAGDIYKSENNISKAYQMYAIASANANNSFLDQKTRNDIERNYLQTKLLLGENVSEDISKLLKSSSPLLMAYGLELTSLNNLKNGKSKEAQREIIAAYKIAQASGTEDLQLAYKAAVALSYDSLYDESTLICKNNLDTLYRKGAVHTSEFYNFLTLLGINTYYLATNNEKSLEKAKNILDNAKDLGKIIKNKTQEDAQNYYSFKIRLLKKEDPKIIDKYAPNLIDNLTTYRYQKDLCSSVADYMYNYDKERGKFYYSSLEEILSKSPNTFFNPLGDLYVELIKKYPEDEAEYVQKLAELKGSLNYREMPLKGLLSIAQKYDETNNDKLNDLINSTIDSNSKYRKNIAQYYKHKQNIKKEIEYKSSVQSAGKNLSEIAQYVAYEATESTSNRTELKALSKFIYLEGNNLVKDFINVSDYSGCSDLTTSIQNISSLVDLDQKDKLKVLMQNTLVNYKAGNYYTAERVCEEFFKELTGFSNPLYVNAATLIKGNSEAKNKQIAATVETLGIINLKNHNYSTAKRYYLKAIQIREQMKTNDIYLANDYSALARITIIDGSFDSSKAYHKKCLQILEDKYANENFYQDEKEFHNKYYGFSFTSFMKFFISEARRNEIISKFRCYNRELNICG